MPLFSTLTMERICSEIGNAQRHVILAAPGIGMPVADALLMAFQRLPKSAVQVVLDVSASVARLGYGEHVAVEKLATADIPLHQHEGLRIGVLICDDVGWSFATSPSLVEADPAGDSEAFNAIALTTAQVMVLRAELPAINKEDEREPAPEYTVVGTELVNEATLTKVKRALDIAPPQQFELARQTQVYAALIQFVELTFEGFNIQSRRVQLPKTLPLIASKDKAVKDRLTTSLKVLDQIEKPKALREVTMQLEELRNAYLVPVGQAGRIMLKSKRADFGKELKAIEDSLEACKKTLVTDLQAALKGVVDAIASGVTLASARHTNRALVGLEGGAYQVRFQTSSSSLLPELQRSFPATQEADAFQVATEANLAALLRRAASLSRALPSQAANDYQQTVAAELAELPAGIAGTEVERMVRQRVGQNKFRDAMLDYWGGACAVTAVAIPEVLRASHAKPWVECASDAERLDVFNGFLLSANLDALFDRFLISFDEQGILVIAPALADKGELSLRGRIAPLDAPIPVRWAIVGVAVAIPPTISGQW